MPIAKKTLRVGTVIYATAGRHVSQSAVDRYGWSADVEADKSKAEKKKG